MSVIDLVDSSPEASPARREESIPYFLNEENAVDEPVDLTRSYSDDDDEEVFALSEPKSRWEEEMEALHEDEKRPALKKSRVLSPSEKLRRMEKRKGEAQRKRCEKQAKAAGEINAYANDHPRTRSRTRLRCSASLQHEFPALVDVLKEQGFALTVEETAFNRKVRLPSLEWYDEESDNPTGVAIVVVNLLQNIPGNLRESLKSLVAALSDENKATVAVVGPERHRLLPTIAWLEDRVKCRCVIPPKVGQDLVTKATAKLVELVQSYTRTVERAAQNEDEKDEDSRTDLFAGLQARDLTKWPGAKPKTNLKAWRYLVHSVVPKSAADAVVEKYASFRSLYEALESGHSGTIENISIDGQRRVGPALAERLSTVFTSLDPEDLPQRPR